jgi:hypothetical protein
VVTILGEGGRGEGEKNITIEQQDTGMYVNGLNITMVFTLD